MSGRADGEIEVTDELDLAAVLSWLAGTDVTYVRLRVGSTEIVYSKAVAGATAAPTDGSAHADPATAPVPPAPAPAPVAAASEVGPVEEADGADRGDGGAGGDGAAEATVDVTAPLVGIFHHSPAPGAPPYVEPGGRVGATTTVGLLESMKVFTAVPAGTAGVVVAVLVPNGQPVEKGQPLVRVRPDAAV